MDDDEVNQNNGVGDEQQPMINDDALEEAEPSEPATASSAQLTAADEDDNGGSQNLDDGKPSTSGSNDGDAVVPAALPDINQVAANVSDVVTSQLPATIPEEDQEDAAADAQQPQDLNEILDPNHVRSNLHSTQALITDQRYRVAAAETDPRAPLPTADRVQLPTGPGAHGENGGAEERARGP